MAEQSPGRGSGATANVSSETRAELPPGRALYQLAIGHYVSHALALAVKLGVADIIGDGRCSIDELAAATETHGPALRRLLGLLVSVGVFAEDDGRFALTPLGTLLREDANGSMKAMVTVFAGDEMQESWRELEYCVRTGLPAFKKHDPDADAFAAMAKDPDAAATFDKAMATFAPQIAAAVASAYDFSAFRTVVDVGGGNGALLIGVLTAYPTLRGTVFDLPGAVERAHENIAESGLADRLGIAGGSFFDTVPGGADAYLLKHVIHDWNDHDAATILRVCRRDMPAHAKLLIVEGLYPAQIDTSMEARGAAANDVNMLVNTGGRQRSEAEFRQLYAAAGFELARIVPTPAGFGIIEGRPV